MEGDMKEHFKKLIFCTLIILQPCLVACANNYQISNNNPQTPAQQAWHACYGQVMLSDRSNNIYGAMAHANQACGPYPQ
jgi:hypothetical protein